MESSRKTEYNRKRAFEEFERCYRYAYSCLAEPRKWLDSRELELLGQFNGTVSAEIERKRDSLDDELSLHCDMSGICVWESKILRMAIYWLMEETLGESQKLKTWYYYENKEKPLGVIFVEKETGLTIDWTINLKEYYSKEVWA